jgi:hypothetical protein
MQQLQQLPERIADSELNAVDLLALSYYFRAVGAAVNASVPAEQSQL